MAVITDADFAWSTPVTLVSDEIWQSRGDTIYITTAGTPAEDDGLELRVRASIRLPAGAQVRYRKIGSGPVDIAREAV